MSKEQEEKTPVCALGTTGPTDGITDLVPEPTTTSSRFTKNEKWFIVSLIAFIGLFRQSFSFLALKLFLTDSITAR